LTASSGTPIAARSETETYDAYAERVVESGIILDPWLAGEPRLAQEPLVVSEKQHAELARVAEDIAEAYEEMCQLVDEDDDVLDSFFALRPAHKLMWNAARPLWHGFARADVFDTPDGYVISELNCDTPTGEPEATVLSALAAADRPDLIDPNRNLESSFVSMLGVMMERLVESSAPKTIGIVYPTEFTEDLSVVRLSFSARHSTSGSTGTSAQRCSVDRSARFYAITKPTPGASEKAASKATTSRTRCRSPIHSSQQSPRASSRRRPS
jgi:hypothetical protein